MGIWKALIILTREEREELTKRAASRSLAAADVFKARLILALADGHSYSSIERELNTPRPTIARWKARFDRGGMEGLETDTSAVSPRTLTPAVVATVF